MQQVNGIFIGHGGVFLLSLVLVKTRLKENLADGDTDNHQKGLKSK